MASEIKRGVSAKDWWSKAQLIQYVLSLTNACEKKVSRIESSPPKPSEQNLAIKLVGEIRSGSDAETWVCSKCSQASTLRT